MRSNEVQVCRLLLLTLAKARSFQSAVVSCGPAELSAALPDHATCQQHFDQPIFT